MQFETRKISYLNFINKFESDLRAVDSQEREKLSSKSQAGQHIIIDFGCDTMKAGYPSCKGPLLVMKSLAAKFNSVAQSGSKNSYPQVGHSYQQIDAGKNSFVSVYERNLIEHHFKYQQCCDHIFSSLGCVDQAVRNPLVITETLANPQYIRQQQIELFFQCYNVDELFLGIDALFAYFHELNGDLNRYQTETRLLISFGGTTTHVIPIIEGKVDYGNIRRMNIGGNNAFDMFCKLVTLKNPSIKKYLTISFLRNMYTTFCEIALDYKKQLQYFRNEGVITKSTAYKNRIEEQNKAISEPQNFINPIQIIIEQPQMQLSLEYQQRREEVKKMMSERLRQALERKKNQKIKLHRQEYQELIDLKKRWQQDPDNTNDQLVELLGNNAPQKSLKKRIKALQVKLNLPPSQPEEKKSSLLEVPDSELDIKGLRMKRLQEYRKRAAEEKEKKRKETQEEQNKLKQLRQENPELYLDKLKSRYNQLSGRLKQNQKQKQQSSNRNSQLSRQRIRNIISLEDGELSEENFGENEQDWKLYQINQESDHQSQLDAIEQQLRDVDPSWMQSSDRHHLNTGNALYLSTQLIRQPEIYFQPYLVGNEQVNLPDCVLSSLKYYPKSTQQKLLSNVLLVGGGCNLRGLEERLKKQLVSNFDSEFRINVTRAKQPRDGAFLGMQLLTSKHSHYVRENSITKIQYQSRKIKSQQHLFNNILWD